MTDAMHMRSLQPGYRAELKERNKRKSRLEPGLLLDFTCKAVKMKDGQYEVTVVGGKTGETYTRIGHHPLWELTRILARQRRRTISGLEVLDDKSP